MIIALTVSYTLALSITGWMLHHANKVRQQNLVKQNETNLH